jgi:hypothetical protein
VRGNHALDSALHMPRDAWTRSGDHLEMPGARLDLAKEART